jgi:plasmid stabilization system protein ParE
MSRVIWAPSALLDLHRLYRFLAKKNLDAAKRAIAAIRKGVKIIVAQANIGKPVDLTKPEYREWLINFGDSGYVVLYHFNGKTVVIVAIRHQKETGWHAELEA